MKYAGIVSGKFISRPNRFIAKVDIDGREETVHVKNTGRCRELLVPGCTVYLSESDNPSRKTRYDLVTVVKERDEDALIINMDSQMPNAAAEEWLYKGELFPDGSIIRREVKHGSSRFDFYIECGERRIFLEVKGVTLEQDGVAMFPDAPTQRGIKHIDELISCMDEGYEACILFVIQMKGVDVFMPNDVTHKAFGAALRRAAQRGVRILAMDCTVTEDSVTVDKPIPIRL